MNLQMRHEEALNEQVRAAELRDIADDQSRLEADLEGRDELLDRLRGRAAEAERLLRESAKRALEQVR